jgi:hypothetical protein
MRPTGVVLVLVGLALIGGSCSLFPSQFGSDYAAVNPVGIMGGVFGGLLAIAGLALLLGSDRIE